MSILALFDHMRAAPAPDPEFRTAEQRRAEIVACVERSRRIVADYVARAAAIAPTGPRDPLNVTLANVQAFALPRPTVPRSQWRFFNGKRLLDG